MNMKPGLKIVFLSLALIFAGTSLGCTGTYTETPIETDPVDVAESINCTVYLNKSGTHIVVDNQDDEEYILNVYKSINITDNYLYKIKPHKVVNIKPIYGDGVYIVELKNSIESSVISEYKLELIGDSDPKTYLSSTYNCLCSRSEMEGYIDFGDNFETDRDLIEYIYSTVSSFEYDKEKALELVIKPELFTFYTPNIGDTFSDKKGICFDLASTLVGSARLAGIPARMVYGYVDDLIEQYYHCWAEVYLDNQWVFMDPTNKYIDDMPVNIKYTIVGYE